MSLTRFAGWGTLPARLLIALLLLVCAFGAAISLQPAGVREEAVVDVSRTDLALYSAIAARVGTGENYYPAVVDEQRRRNYPLRPFVTVRLPTLAWLIGTIGAGGAALLLKLLMIAAIAAVTVRLRKITDSRPLWAGATCIAAASMVLLTVPAMTFWHESWSALLIALSLACRSRSRWGASVALGLAAILVRELALPYLCVMAVLALKERNKAEAAAWIGAILVFFGALATHAWLVSGYVTAADPQSPGWSSSGGWPFILALVQRCSLFGLLPLPLVALAVPLALLGWASLRGETVERGALMLIGYIGAFMAVGRPDNFYWGIMIAPLLPIGLAFTPAAIRDLLRSAAPAPARSRPVPAE
jgi:hypothetical protein